MTGGTLLILGGTAEAAALAAALTGRYGRHWRIVTSLAGRVARPAARPGLMRSGGFGGASGLAGWLRREKTRLVVDATHPFAVTMAAHAATACASLDIPRLRLLRLAWRPAAGDRWIAVPDLAAAAAWLDGACQERALLTAGSGGLAYFAAVRGPRLFARVMSPPVPAAVPAGCTILLDPGPFTLAAERALLDCLGVSLLVARNSGGASGRARLRAARERGIRVLMVARPPQPAGPAASSVDGALDWVRCCLDAGPV